jgi:hypothetical protein
MGKKPQQRRWPEAMRLCRLNPNDVEMARRLGFQPDALIRLRPSPKDRWKLPVNQWVRERYYKRFGQLLGAKPVMVCAPVAAELDPEEPRRFEEELYWEDYRARNEDEPAPKKPKGKQAKPAPAASPPPQTGMSDDDIPF